MLKKFTILIISRLASIIIKKHKPLIIGITGTVGKTTASNFIFDFLTNLYGKDVYISPYDYNGEIGLPLSILKSRSPNKNIFLWVVVFLRSIALYFSNNYPRYLVLEYGIDRPGEMKLLTGIAIPDIAIILNISPNHVSQFPDYKDYINEKLLLGQVSRKVIFNGDDNVLYNEFSQYDNAFSFGENLEMDIHAKILNSSIDGLEIEFIDGDEKIVASYPILGDHQLYNLLPVYALGKMLHISISKAKELLKDVHTQKGRGTLIRGVCNSVIIDGSYNGGFLSISSGIKYMQNLSGEYNKILFLGEMRELSTESKKLHLELSSILVNGNFNYLILVGEEMNKYVYEELKNKYGESLVFRFRDSRVAGDKIREIIQNESKKSVIYVKGSQNTIFLEEGIKKFLFDLADSEKLCRQSEKWLKTKDDFFTHII